MPTIAEQQIAEIAGWLVLSSLEWKTPLGDIVVRGRYATIVPVGINAIGHPSYSSVVAQGVLPLLTPQLSAQAVDLSPPNSQSALVERTRHILWKIEQGHLPKVAVVGLPSSATSIQTALNSAGIGTLDLTSRGVLAVPLYALSAFELGRISPKLPLR
jgi:hypothetical protein